GSSSWSRLQPVLVDLDVDGVMGRSDVSRPEVTLAEADPVEGDRRTIVQAVPLFLGIDGGRQNPLDDADLAPAVVRGAQVPGRVAPRHGDLLAGPEARRRAGPGRLSGSPARARRWAGLRDAGGHHAAPRRSLTSSTLRAISSEVRIPFC